MTYFVCSLQKIFQNYKNWEKTQFFIIACKNVKLIEELFIGSSNNE